MKNAITVLAILSASSAFADEASFPRTVICGKVQAYRFSTSKKLGLRRQVEFASANLITFTSADESQSRAVSSQEDLLHVSLAKDDLSKGVLKNSITDLSVAVSLKQTVCLDSGSMVSGPVTLYPMGRATDEQTALEQVISLWK